MKQGLEYLGPEPLSRRLGVLALWLLVVNGMIGAGIFGVQSEAERLAGGFSPWVFALCGLLIAPVMLSFAWLSSAFRGTGGPMVYAGAAFGPFVGVQVGWAFYIARLTAFAANVNLLVTTIGFLWSEPMGPAVRVGLLFIVCGLLVWVNVMGAKAAVRSLGVLTVLKLAPLIALAFVGLIGLDRAVFASIAAPPGVTDLGAATLLVIYAYVGFESGLVPAGESKQPQRDMPRALLAGLLAVTAVYVFVQMATQRLLPDLQTSERPIVEVGESLFGRTGAIIVVLAIIASVGGNLLGAMFSSPRVTYRMALDGQMPAWLGRVHPRHETPWTSVVLFGVAAFVLAATGSFVWLAALSVLTRLGIYLVCIASMPRVRRAAGDAPGLLRLPGGPVIPVLGLLVCIGLLTRVSGDSVVATAVMLAVGSVLYAAAVVACRRCGRS